MRSPCALTMAVLGLVVSADAQSWTKASPQTSPSGRMSVEAAFNPFRQRTVLYGGRTKATLGLQETWTWDGKDWTLHKPLVSPPGKWAHNLALDWHRTRVVLFGGREGTTDTNNTWEWDGKQLGRGEDQDPAPGQAQLRHGLRHEAQGDRDLRWRRFPGSAG